jgi:hypothetical protein
MQMLVTSARVAHATTAAAAAMIGAQAQLLSHVTQHAELLLYTIPQII